MCNFLKIVFIQLEIFKKSQNMSVRFYHLEAKLTIFVVVVLVLIFAPRVQLPILDNFQHYDREVYSIFIFSNAFIISLNLPSNALSAAAASPLNQ